MRFGIPKYRLPRDVLDAEVKRITDLGVAIEYNTKVSNIQESMLAGGFDAAFLAVGAHIAKRAYIPAGEAAKVLDAVQVLRSMEGEEKPLLGRRVVVYGGGNTALDVARTAKRLGAEEAVIDGVVQVGPNMMTGVAGIFAGGDMVPSERTVTVGVGHGKKAARYIDAWLRGEVYAPGPKHEIASADKLNTWYYGEAPKTLRPVLELARRILNIRGSRQGS